MYKLIPMDTSDWALGHCKDDPVRPHLPLAWRATNGRRVYGLEHTDGTIGAVICVARCNHVPISEDELELSSSENGSVAVFYTVWSYARGAGRQMVLDCAAHIQATTSCERFVTLSPLTDMAERFHLNNGAQFITRGDTCQNFEYTL